MLFEPLYFIVATGKILVRPAIKCIIMMSYPGYLSYCVSCLHCIGFIRCERTRVGQAANCDILWTSEGCQSES